ncbi:unnamed protein product, partial [Choristocarpus tenellus]
VFDAVLSEEQAAPITGVLIVQKESVLHLIETSMDTSTSFLRHLQSMEDGVAPHERIMDNIKILVSSEDCPTPYFPKWFNYYVQVNPESNIDINREDPIEASWGVLDKLAELAKEMSQQQSSISASELKRKFYHLVPSNERVLGLAESNKNMTLSEYLQVYDTPISAILESERVWPIPSIMRY